MALFMWCHVAVALFGPTLLSWPPPRIHPRIWGQGTGRMESGMACLLHVKNGMEVDFLKQKPGKKRLEGVEKSLAELEGFFGCLAGAKN